MSRVRNGDSDDDPRTDRTGGRRGSPAGLFMALLIVAILLLPGYIWFFCRIEPEQGMIAVLTHKTGRDLPSGQILALDKAEKGIQLAVLSEGRYFKNPFTWQWQLHPIADIPSGKLGVQTRLYGKDLPPGRILATEGTKGILPEILGPGKHRVNPYAYHVDIHDAINIRAGYVGVKTLLVGADVLHDSLPADQRNSFLVAETSKGVVSDVLDPGTYYLNPFVVNVVEVNLQSQRFEMSGEDAINFLTLDGFTISVEGTIEFGIERQKAALITHRVGDMEDVVTKVVLPKARGFSRIEGSKYPAIDFIVGETRQQFQRQLEEHLRKNSVEWGVAIKSVLIRKIVVPDEIASISRDREIAVQDARKFEQQTEQAKSKAELVKQETLALQNKVKVEVETERIRALIAANQDQLVQVIAAQRELGVAKLDNQSAVFQAEAVLAKAAGDRDAVKAGNEAEATVLRAEVAALGSGDDLARYAFYRAIAPRIETVLASDRADSLGGLFAPFIPPAAPPHGPRATKEVMP